MVAEDGAVDVAVVEDRNHLLAFGESAENAGRNGIAAEQNEGVEVLVGLEGAGESGGAPHRLFIRGLHIVHVVEVEDGDRGDGRVRTHAGVLVGEIGQRSKTGLAHFVGSLDR